MRELRVAVYGGRELACTDIGAPVWPCVFFFHGAPASRLRLAHLEHRFLAEKVRVVSPDRPGYGGSTPQPGRGLLDWAADVAALADALGIQRFLAAGHSSGGPYGLLCGALLPERVLGTITLGGVTDMAWQGAWPGYPELERQIMRLTDERAAVAFCEDRFGADGRGFMAASNLEFPEPDERLYADEQVAACATAARREAFRQGVGGYAQDIFVQGRPWTFDPGDIAGPLVVVHGEQDTLLPLGHSRYTSELVSGSELRVLPGHGHFTILGELPALAAELGR